MKEKNTALLAAVFAKAADNKKMTRGNAGIVIYARDIKKFYLCKRGGNAGDGCFSAYADCYKSVFGKM